MQVTIPNFNLAIMLHTDLITSLFVVQTLKSVITDPYADTYHKQ